ncbi:uncharacterized protein si:ch211-51h4.2 isoform X1 [Tachysurus ichikawai]
MLMAGTDPFSLSNLAERWRERRRCWAVVDIVPQMAVKPVLEEKLLNTSLVRMETTRPAHTFIYSNISLEE